MWFKSLQEGTRHIGTSRILGTKSREESLFKVGAPSHSLLPEHEALLEPCCLQICGLYQKPRGSKYPIIRYLGFWVRVILVQAWGDVYDYQVLGPLG